MAASLEAVKKLREATSAGIMECRKALEEAGGDHDKAIALLHERGAAAALAKEGRRAEEGAIMAYVHHGGKLGALVEVNCETDFVARNEEFIALARELAMQVAATSPKFLAKEDVPEDYLAAQRKEFAVQAATVGKPVEPFVAERVEQHLATVCLLEQPYIRDASLTVSQLVTDKVAKFKERIRVKRFVVYKLGQAEDAAG